MIAQVVNDFGDASYQQSSELPGWASAALFVLAIGFVVVLIASIWTILKAGGQPGWHALVPVLNTYSLANAAQLHCRSAAVEEVSKGGGGRSSATTAQPSW